MRRAAQRVLQQPCQFTVSVGHPHSGGRVEGVDYFAEREQGQVDGAALLQTDALIAGTAVVLRASEVNQVELPRLLPARQLTLRSYNLDGQCKGR